LYCSDFATVLFVLFTIMGDSNLVFVFFSGCVGGGYCFETNHYIMHAYKSFTEILSRKSEVSDV